jgi:mono/diheme cytochrome c family protein
MVRRGSWIAVGIVVALAAVGVGAWATLLRGGISARREPGAVEVRAARALRGWAIPAEARQARSPMTASPRTIALGLAHFADHCASCHGNDGSGRTELGLGMYPRPPDLRAAATQSLTDGELFYVIENGIRFTGMPGWGGGPGSADGSWQLVHFIRHLPRLTAEERAQMEALNPKSPAEVRAEQDEDAFLRDGTVPAQAQEQNDAAHAHR